MRYLRLCTQELHFVKLYSSPPRDMHQLRLYIQRVVRQLVQDGTYQVALSAMLHLWIVYPENYTPISLLWMIHISFPYQECFIFGLYIQRAIQLAYPRYFQVVSSFIGYTYLGGRRPIRVVGKIEAVYYIAYKSSAIGFSKYTIIYISRLTLR